MSGARIALQQGILRSQSDLPSQLKVFKLMSYTGNRLEVGAELLSLDILSLGRARDLVELPRLGSVRCMDMSFVEELVIDSCAPVQDWRFLEGKTRLRRLFIDRTKFIAPDDRAAKCMAAVEHVHIPSLRISREL